jgi:probable rRNA maturation factor
MKRTIEIANRTGFSVRERIMKRIASEVAEKEKIRGTMLSIALVRPSTMKTISRTFHKKDNVANVLSFGWNESSPWYSGEIILCPTKIRHEASRWDMSFGDFFMKLFLHGLLHVAGHVHSNPRKASRMESRELYWLNRFHSSPIL